MSLKSMYDAAQAASQDVANLANRIDALFNEGKTEEALALSEELKAVKAKAKNANQLYLEMQDALQGGGDTDPGQRFVPANGDPEPKDIKELRSSKAYSEQFTKALKNGITPSMIKNGMRAATGYELLMNALTETGGTPAGAEGGFLLPIDFDGMVKELQRQAVDLAPFFGSEEVNAFSGWRAVEKAAAALPFAKLTEGNDIAEMENPAFAKVEYTLDDYAGYLPAQANIFSDTPVAIAQYIARWVGKKKSLTNTSLLLSLVNAITPTPVTDHKTVFTAIKTALNKTLDPAISVSAKIFVNQTGFDLLDQMVDGTGRPLLAPDPTNELVKRFKGREIVQVSNRQWADTDTNTKTRIAIGDGTQFATLFRRAADELSSTNVGGDAWRKNQVEFRYITRLDPVVVDEDAMVLLSVTLP